MGSRKFDPKKLGFEAGPGKGLFEVDTTRPGNLNTGHEFADGQRPGVIGPKLSRDERLALIEYIKTL